MSEPGTLKVDPENFIESLRQNFKKQQKQAKDVISDAQERKYKLKVINRCMDKLNIPAGERYALRDEPDLDGALQSLYGGTFLEGLYILHESITIAELLNNTFKNKRFWKTFTTKISDLNSDIDLKVVFEVKGWGTCILFRTDCANYVPAAGSCALHIFARDTEEEDAFVTSLNSFLENLSLDS